MSAPVVEKIDLDNSASKYLTTQSEEFPPELGIGRESEAIKWVENQIDLDHHTLPAKLQEIKEAISIGTDVVEIRGIPLVGPLPDTPNRYSPVESADVHQFDIAQIALSALAGLTYGYKHVRGGRILADVFPKQDFEHKKDSAFGSREAFDFHADGAVQPDIMSQYFSLHCLKNPTSTPTIISTISVDDFSPEVASLLQEPVYELFYEGRITGAHSIKELPIIELKDGKTILRYYGSTKVDVHTEGDKEPYQAALYAFDQALHNNKVEASLEPGDIIFVNNRTTLHSRPAFNDNQLAQANRRWSRRLYTATQGDLLQRVQSQISRVLVSSNA